MPPSMSERPAASLLAHLAASPKYLELRTVEDGKAGHHVSGGLGGSDGGDSTLHAAPEADPC